MESLGNKAPCLCIGIVAVRSCWSRPAVSQAGGGRGGGVIGSEPQQGGCWINRRGHDMIGQDRLLFISCVLPPKTFQLIDQSTIWIAE